MTEKILAKRSAVIFSILMSSPQCHRIDDVQVNGDVWDDDDSFLKKKTGNKLTNKQHVQGLKDNTS